MHPNEKRFFDLVAAGVYAIDDNNDIWRMKRKHRKVYVPEKLKIKDNRGYRCIFFHDANQKKYIVQHHRIIYIYRVSDIPDGMQINHIDGNKANNSLSNLEIVTQAENIRHSIYITKTKKMLGADNVKNKLSFDDVGMILYLRYFQDWKLKDLAGKFGISKAHVSRICLLKVWRHCISSRE